MLERMSFIPKATLQRRRFRVRFNVDKKKQFHSPKKSKLNVSNYISIVIILRGTHARASQNKKSLIYSLQFFYSHHLNDVSLQIGSFFHVSLNKYLEIFLIFPSAETNRINLNNLFVICQVFRARTPPDAIQLVARLLEYTPSARITPLQACAHPFFNELRESNQQLPNGRDLPPLFNFTDAGMLSNLIDIQRGSYPPSPHIAINDFVFLLVRTELAIQPSLNASLMPRHSQQNDAANATDGSAASASSSTAAPQSPSGKPPHTNHMILLFSVFFFID